jgi:CheY-like chemotaxis protein
MPESIVAVMPHASDVNVVRGILSVEGIELQLAGSPEEALRVLTEAGNSTSVILYDADRGQPWRDALPRFHQFGQDCVLSCYLDQRIGGCGSTCSIMAASTWPCGLSAPLSFGRSFATP